MRLPIPHYEVTEIFVERNEYPLMTICMGQNGPIARVLRPLTDSLNIVAILTYLVRNRRPERRVEQESHVPALTSRGANRSPAMAR